MSAIVNRHISDQDAEKIFLVGGTACLADLEKVITNFTGITTVKPHNPLLVTPLGIAMHCM